MRAVVSSSSLVRRGRLMMWLCAPTASTVDSLITRSPCAEPVPLPQDYRGLSPVAKTPRRDTSGAADFPRPRRHFRGRGCRQSPRPRRVGPRLFERGSTPVRSRYATGIWRRRETPSFWRRTSECAFTVRGEMPSCSPISSFERPAAMSSTTWRWRSVSAGARFVSASYMPRS